MLHKPLVKWTLILLGVPVILLVLLWGGLEYAAHRNEQELETTMDTMVEAPEEWELVEEEHGGNLMCLDVCQFYSQEFKVRAAKTEIEKTFQEVVSGLPNDFEKGRERCDLDNENDDACFMQARNQDYDFVIYLDEGDKLENGGSSEAELVVVNFTKRP